MGEEIPREDFKHQYMAAGAQAFTSEIILKAWKNSGIRPFNPHIFTDQDFAPSMATSTEAHVPLSYPIQPHELPALEDVTAEEVELRNSWCDSEDDSASGTATWLPNTKCQHIASVLAPISQPTQSSSSIMPPALLESNPDLASYFLSMENKVNQLESRVQNLELDAEAKNDKLEAAKAHCAMALSQIRALNKQLNVKKKS
ncbi:hypothetical protein PISMIDRAFT_22968 [Pisolithus microcarpus 441]|uniref:Uncharacterized protein n=1 Tax=Pisolithus microcarpus 441 TaxID=765257 RepID=A0A0C9Z764_9AGAM|nr:hypothetical protein BKA83DRAFT_22968 [Pisolithus microcarpus]KIK25086.1 hypothetical protein PISMIDRAFT_22968 [Pisolithus microcarpus 441]